MFIIANKSVRQLDTLIRINSILRLVKWKQVMIVWYIYSFVTKQEEAVHKAMSNFWAILWPLHRTTLVSQDYMPSTWTWFTFACLLWVIINWYLLLLSSHCIIALVSNHLLLFHPAIPLKFRSFFQKTNTLAIYLKLLPAKSGII